MKCKTCDYYNQSIKKCMFFKRTVEKKKSCWAHKEKPTIVEQAFKFLKKRGE